ncbi:GNAT family N-acetyltransferase [Bordetella genomosp. 11]|uniref:GNAT family N-acetyltransferase n=1 Tax=Bordetella genomosp. 11 TaxID=1416808 RepID=A0A261UIC1_9BORD|nr:GNAT family N-acetyltransferase [Bordetella genomosp. 11]OZI61664.1 GNAT family N-acetyltransferase [Bordetella genomosp. 11]
MDISVTHDPASHRFKAIVDQHESHLEYALRDGVMAILHTIVPPEVGGRGIAGHLTVAAIEYARSHALKIAPQCAYAAAYFQRHPEYADLLA